MVITASVCTASHRNHPTRLWHLIVHPGQGEIVSYNVKPNSRELLTSPTFRNTILLPPGIEHLDFYQCLRLLQLIFLATFSYFVSKQPSHPLLHMISPSKSVPYVLPASVSSDNKDLTLQMAFVFHNNLQTRDSLI